jgi:ammonia channel protein AmtB
VTYALPVVLVGFTALITSGLVHAGYAIWWLSRQLLRSEAVAYDWAGALVVSGVATTVVLVAGLMVRRLAAGSPPPAQGQEAAAVAVRADH